MADAEGELQEDGSWTLTYDKGDNEDFGRVRRRTWSRREPVKLWTDTITRGFTELASLMTH